MKRMERIENLDLVAFQEQGIVGADVFIPMSTTLFPPAAWLSTVPDGSIPRHASFCLSERSATPSAASSASSYVKCFSRTDCSSMAHSNNLPHLTHSASYSGNSA